jgi:hypothetical protein
MGKWRLNPPFLTSVVDGREWQASRHCISPPARGNRSHSHYIGGWMGPKPVWTLQRRKKSLASAYYHYLTLFLRRTY